MSVYFHSIQHAATNKGKLASCPKRANVTAEELLPDRSPSGSSESVAGSGHLQPMVGPRSLEESSDKGHVVTRSYCSRHSDHRVHASAGELTEVANLHPIVMNERPKNIGILG